MEETKPLDIVVRSKPYQFSNSLENDHPIPYSMDVLVDGVPDGLLHYEPDGSWKIGENEHAALVFRPIPAGSHIRFADGMALTVLEDKARMKAISDPVIQLEREQGKRWKKDNTITLTLSDEEAAHLMLDTPFFGERYDLKDSAEKAIHFAIQHGPALGLTVGENLKHAMKEAQKALMESYGHDVKEAAEMVGAFVRETSEAMKKEAQKQVSR